MNDAQALNADFLRFVETHFPQWLDHVQVLRDDEADQEYLHLTVPDPSGLTHKYPLQVSTYHEEITICFSGWHTHYPWQMWFDEVLDFLRALLNEEVIIASVFSAGRIRQTSTAEPSDLTIYAGVPAGDYELCITSWRGTYERRFSIDWDAYGKAVATALNG
jgi:hypothetical protein